MTKRKPKAVRAWGAFTSRGHIHYHPTNDGAWPLATYKTLPEAKAEWHDDRHAELCRVTITVDAPKRRRKP